IVGLTIEHSKSNASELAEEFIKQNKNIIVEDKKLSILTCTESAAGEICFYLSPRQPIKNTKDEVVGIAYQGINLMNTTMMNSAIALFRDKKGVLKQGLLTFKSAHDDKYDFNARELDCLAFLLRGFSVKEIANRLKLGVRSVEYYVACMRHKFSVGSKNALIDKAMSLGYFNFVPEHWLSY
ncbi:helix-turn-helix transcriptional regulator, partial [Fangia hongkongensis]